MRALITLLAVAGCAGDNSGGPADDAVPLGAHGIDGYHVAAGASAAIPSGDFGYVVTANGEGGYRLTWSDPNGSASEFSGSITTDGDFDPSLVQDLTGSSGVALSAPNQIDFDSVPGANLDGVDLFSADPIYVDARIDGQGGAAIYFVDASTDGLAATANDPVAFVSP